MLWFSYDFEDGVQFHNTEDEAKASAENMLQLDTEYAAKKGHWPENTNSICWGRVHGMANDVSDDGDVCDYRLEAK